MFLKRKMNDSTDSYSDKILQIKEKIREADAIIIGAGAGLSTSAGFVYNGERFEKYFSGFRKKYGFSDMYAGGFYPYKTLEKHWGYWCRYIYINRYMDAPKPVYQNLYDLVKQKDYFVLTTNVDHCFQKAGFDKNRIFCKFPAHFYLCNQLIFHFKNYLCNALSCMVSFSFRKDSCKSCA